MDREEAEKILNPQKRAYPTQNPAYEGLKNHERKLATMRASNRARGVLVQRHREELQELYAQYVIEECDLIREAKRVLEDEDAKGAIPFELPSRPDPMTETYIITEDRLED